MVSAKVLGLCILYVLPHCVVPVCWPAVFPELWHVAAAPSYLKLALTHQLCWRCSPLTRPHSVCACAEVVYLIIGEHRLCNAEMVFVWYQKLIRRSVQLSPIEIACSTNGSLAGKCYCGVSKTAVCSGIWNFTIRLYSNIMHIWYCHFELPATFAAGSWM